MGVVPRRPRWARRAHDRGAGAGAAACARRDAGRSQHGYRAYPLVDHVADKVIAMFELRGTRRLPSTRYKDLVDLVAIAVGASTEAEAQLTALRAQAERRELDLPARSTSPTELCGSWAMRPRPVGLSCPRRRRSTRRSRSSRRSSTRCLTAARRADGTPTGDAGGCSRTCPAFEGENPPNVEQAALQTWGSRG